MNASKRKMEIFARLQAQGSVEVSELAERFGVAAITIRRDLSLFEQQGLIVTSYGGATLKQGAGIEPSFALKQGQMTGAKQRIAQKAVEYLSDGDSVILDCGTTTLEVLGQIGRKKLTIITGSWPAVNYLHGNARVELYLAPGLYSETSAGVISAMTGAFFKSFYADVVLMGTQGLCPHRGATVPGPADASLKETLAAQGKKRILLADSSKVGQVFLSRFAFAETFEAIITDSSIAEDALQTLRERCKEVVVV